MKKRIALFLCLMLIAVSAGCGGKNGTAVRQGNQPPGVEEVLKAGMEEEDRKRKKNKDQRDRIPGPLVFFDFAGVSRTVFKLMLTILSVGGRLCLEGVSTLNG